MVITFYSNYLTHHQIPFCKAMTEIKDVNFIFVSTMPMERERKDGGWEISKYPFELRAYVDEASQKKAEQLAIESDVVIHGAAPEKFVELRMRNNAFPLTFRYGERIYKTGRWRIITPRSFVFRYRSYLRYLNKPLYMLCASSFASTDLALLGTYIGRCYKWGYFPETRRYTDIEKLIATKERGSILWVGRLIALKHPELPVLLAEYLRDSGYQFHLRMIGVGDQEEKIREMIREKKLESFIEMVGTVSPGQVRSYMEQSYIHIATSDKNEGWGAVLNEAMNSGCVVVANKNMGASAYLIKSGTNGYIYDGSFNDFCTKVKYVLDNKLSMKSTAISGYETIVNEWCAETAAKRFYELACAKIKKENYYIESGPCSKA